VVAQHLYMLIISTISISFFLSINLILISTPLPMGIRILILAILSTLSTALIISSWMAFLIFLIYIRGILILFSYFVAITPNQHDQISTYSILSPLFITVTILIISTLTYPPISPTHSIYLHHIYSQSCASVLIILALTLLLTIIIVVKLLIVPQGPLPPFSF